MPGSAFLPLSGETWMAGSSPAMTRNKNVIEETDDRSAQARRHASASHGPVIETERLMLRQWQGRDMAPYTAMLSDPGHRALHHRRWQACCRRDGRVAARRGDGGHWALHGAGMFVVEEKSSGKFVGRVGPWSPPGWPGFEVGWGIAREFRGKGYARRGRAGVDRLGVCHLRDRPHRPLHRSRERGVSRRGAAAGGASEAIVGKSNL